MSKKAKRSSDSVSSSLAKLCGNIAYLLHEDSLEKYIDKFLYKPVDPEYYVNSSAKADLKIRFLKPFTNNNLLSFICMNMKYNPEYVKEFYRNLELTSVGLESRFKNKIVKFSYSDFITYFGLKVEGYNVSSTKEKENDKVVFVT